LTYSTAQEWGFTTHDCDRSTISVRESCLVWESSEQQTEGIFNVHVVYSLLSLSLNPNTIHSIPSIHWTAKLTHPRMGELTKLLAEVAGKAIISKIGEKP
jgi:hypothetical protein